jgi:hypothetical protein
MIGNVFTFMFIGNPCESSKEVRLCCTFNLLLPIWNPFIEDMADSALLGVSNETNPIMIYSV